MLLHQRKVGRDIMAIKVCTNTTEDMKNTLMPTDGKFQKTWFGIATI